MRKINILFALILFNPNLLWAISIDWTGGYRIESHYVDNPTLSSNREPKGYSLQYLYLNPKIIASDGVNIVGRFDILGNQHNAYKNSQLGTFFGGGTGSDPRVNSQNQESSSVGVSQLYLNANHEFGSLIAGRAPFEFGLGITHNAGNDPFDHWYDTRDSIGYRFEVDNISFMPMISKVFQKDFGVGSTVSDETFVFEYNNKDTGAQAGVVQQVRKSSFESNDSLSATNPLPITGATLSSAWSTKTVNLFLARKFETFNFKFEASFLTGETGLNIGTEPLKQNAFAIATEIMFPFQEGSSWEWGSKLGMASGDNPNTTNIYEGYQMDKNYDVAMLLFNHRLGKADFLTTKLIHTDTTISTGNSADDEAVGNAVYIAPHITYKWNDKLDIKTTFIYAQLATNPTLSLDSTKDLGTELDIELLYRPRERIIWSTQIGILSSGSAWKDGATGYENKTNFGIATKAAITF